MTSNRVEQRTIYNKLLNGTPHIYMEYRRGTSIPSDVHVYKHQKTSNEELAQLIYAGILRDPFTAKDKKKSLFNRDSSDDEILINVNYNKIFNPNNGELFTRSKEEIDELLFVYHLYKESKKMSIREYKKNIQIQTNNLTNETNEEKIKNIRNYIESYNLSKAITNVCTFYCIDYYYAVKEATGRIGVIKYNYLKYYTDSDYQKELINDFNKFFLKETVNLIKNNSSLASLNTWVRDKKRTAIFNDAANRRITGDIIDLGPELDSFIDKYKVDVQ